jgi:UDP-N-acetylglucosamine--N-acetylmuramyl-(pentapeptide) pyrophosphoryl-undecaprenol N-acetylglucosamine transferase
MKRKLQHNKIIISGGGTGGHVFPAISIANALKLKRRELDILFVGAEGKMEMKKVPEAGYPIEGLPVTGLHRGLSIKNVVFIIKLFRSLFIARRIIRRFQPSVVIGVGGYASAPVLWCASKRGIPALIQEQNSFAGITNKIMGKKVEKICVAYENMDKYFPENKIIFTGNPVRQDLDKLEKKKKEALKYFGLENKQEIVLVLGGSGGARTINESIMTGLDRIKNENVCIIWQAGESYHKKAEETMLLSGVENVKLFPFIDRMDLAYSAADVIVSRAGAGTISELYLVGKPVILVPSPNVAEDHQTKNAQVLVKNRAAIMVKDIEARETLLNTVLELSADKKKKELLSLNIRKMTVRNSADLIADEVLKLMKKN